MIEQQTGEQITRSARGDHDQCPCGGIETTSLLTLRTIRARLGIWRDFVNPFATLNRSHRQLLISLMDVELSINRFAL